MEHTLNDEIKALIVSEVEKQVAQKLDQQRSVLDDLNRLQKLEEEYRKTKSIMVLFLNKKEEKEARRIITGILGFARADYLLIDKYTPVDPDEYPLVLFYDIHKNYNEEIIAEYFAKTKLKGNAQKFIYYGQQRIQCLTQHRSLGHAAQSRFALYARLMETFKYLELEKKYQQS